MRCHEGIATVLKHPRQTSNMQGMAYKDSLFRSIFGNEKSALALYNAVSGANLRLEDSEVVMNTLAETIWTPRKNDLSFLVNGSLVVIAEHQSTINENMPYRMLQYACRLFENAVEDKRGMYKQTLIRRPRPRFIVFFNGLAEFPDHKRMRLSDSYEPPTAGYDGIALELEIDVYNVNAGRNRSIIEACEELKGYAFFVSRARQVERELSASGGGLNREEITLAAIRRAIQDCKDAGLLREFWEKMTQEEINMLANEWNQETAMEVYGEERFERGIEIGKEEGMEVGKEEGMKTVAVNALAKGYSVEQIHELTGLDTKTITGLFSQRTHH